MQIQIEVPDRTAAENFIKWFRKKGFDAFTKSKFNKLTSKSTDSYITCIATDEKLTDGGNKYAGQYLDLQ